MNAFSLNNISKTYIRHSSRGRHTSFVFRNFSLTLKCGEILALLGPSGSGKSTLLRILTGNESIDAGEVVVSGRAPLMRARTGKTSLISAESTLLPWRSAKENVRLPLDLLGQRKERTTPIIENLLNAVQIKEHLWTAVPHLMSEGQRQRVRLAQALVTEPDLLLMDEPFSNCDEALRRKLVSMTSSYIQANLQRAAVLVTHHVQEASVLANNVLLFREESDSNEQRNKLHHSKEACPHTKFIHLDIHPKDRSGSDVFEIMNLLSEELTSLSGWR